MGKSSSSIAVELAMISSSLRLTMASYCFDAFSIAELQQAT